jgi:hypothetical protein
MVLEVADKVLGVFDYSIRGKDIIFTVHTKNGMCANFTLMTNPHMNAKSLEKLLRREKTCAVDKLKNRNRSYKSALIDFGNTGAIVQNLAVSHN